jgi:hypothetical protein
VTFPQIAAFARLANGSKAAVRSIAGQKTNMTRSAHTIYYDEVHDEIYLANTFAQAMMVFRGGANGDESPIRIIMGPKTQIQSPEYGMTVDPVNDEIYISEFDKILVFPRTANGDVAPIRILDGPKTELQNPWGTIAIRGVAVDPIHNLLIATTYYQNRGRILIFDRTASGNTAPIRRISGPKSGIAGATFSVRTYPPKGYILNPSAGRIGVWSVFDSGDIPPLYWLENAAVGKDRTPGSAVDDEGDATDGGMGDRFSINRNSKELYSNRGRIIETFSFPEIF